MKIGNLDISSIKVGSADCKVYLGDTLVYPSDIDYSTQYLTFVALEAGSFGWKTPSGRNSSANTVSYSLDNGSTWSTLASGDSTPSVAVGDKVIWKSSDLLINNGIGQFTSTGLFDIEGNIMSLVSGDSFTAATSIGGVQCWSMFSGTKVVNAENLVLEFVNNNCYERMFSGCTSLTTAPELPATTLATACYRYMFKQCSSLSAITCLATTLATNSTSDWVQSVSSTGTFTKASSMSSWTTGNNGIPNGWTVVNA